VRSKPSKFITAVLVSAIGLVLYIWVAPKIGPGHPTWQSFLQVGALAILVFGYRALEGHLERFLKLGGGLSKLRGGPKEWAKRGDD